MNAAGLAAKTGKIVMKPSAARILVNFVRSITVKHRSLNNPGFISVNDIQNVYMPMGFTNFKIEGRGLGSALVLEFLLYYMTKPEYQINVREEIYLDNMLDIF